MKSVLCMILAAILLVLSSSAFATGVDEIDLSVYCLEELKTLQTRIEIEIDSRQSDSESISSDALKNVYSSDAEAAAEYIKISGNGTNVVDDAFILPYEYIRLVLKRSENYNIDTPRITLYYLDEATGNMKSKGVGIPEGGTVHIIHGPLNVQYYTSDSECNWEIQFSPIKILDSIPSMSGSGSYVSDIFTMADKPQVVNIAFTNTSNEYEDFIVSYGLIFPDGSIFEHNGLVVRGALSGNEAKEYREIITPTDSATAYFLSISCSENIQWTISSD